MITTWEGKIIAVESDETKHLQDENLFELYQEKSGKNRERLESARQDFKFHRKNCIKIKYKKQAYYIAYESLGIISGCCVIWCLRQLRRRSILLSLFMSIDYSVL